MFTEKGTLPIGVEYDGKVHSDFEIREQIVRDMIDVFDDPKQALRAAVNSYYLGICITANLLIGIGTIPKEAITADMLLGMYQEDINALKAAEKRLEERRDSFRDKD
jgi:hypothetical protein